MARLIYQNGHSAIVNDPDLLELNNRELVALGTVVAMLTGQGVGRPEPTAALLRVLAYRLEGLTGVPAIDVDHLEHQRAWSTTAFGPGRRTGGIIDHIRRELDEVAEHPTDLYEWVDLIILALDGAWRAGHEPLAIIQAIKEKQARNEARVWPDWRELSEEVAIEHDRTQGVQWVQVSPVDYDNDDAREWGD